MSPVDKPELFVPTSKVVIKVDTTAFNAALEKAGRAFAEFAARVLANPDARAAFERAQKQPLPIAGGHGPAYRARARRRTRSHR